MRRHLAFVLASIIGAAIADPDWPPRLPSGKPVRSDTSERFLQATAKLNPGVAVAREAPTVDFLYLNTVLERAVGNRPVYKRSWPC